MRLLLDTHTLAWAVGDASLLGDAAALLSDPKNVLLVSPASVWEMSINHHAGRWPEVTGVMQRLGLQELLVRIPHMRLAGQLRLEHKDPFDRLLAVQALSEGVALVSKDPAFDAFPVHRVW